MRVLQTVSAWGPANSKASSAVKIWRVFKGAINKFKGIGGHSSSGAEGLPPTVGMKHGKDMPSTVTMVGVGGAAASGKQIYRCKLWGKPKHHLSTHPQPSVVWKTCWVSASPVMLSSAALDLLLGVSNNTLRVLLELLLFSGNGKDALFLHALGSCDSIKSCHQVPMFPLSMHIMNQKVANI